MSLFLLLKKESHPAAIILPFSRKILILPFFFPQQSFKGQNKQQHSSAILTEEKCLEKIKFTLINSSL